LPTPTRGGGCGCAGAGGGVEVDAEEPMIQSKMIEHESCKALSSTSAEMDSRLSLLGAAATGALVTAGIVEFLRTRESEHELSLDDCPGFEGPEKRLEINVRPNADPSKNLRTLMTRHFWDECMSRLDGRILDHMPTEHWDSYIITESSLFVSRTKVIVLTCGTTTLLQCVDFLLAGIRNHGLEVSPNPSLLSADREALTLLPPVFQVEYFQFSRKNYTYPEWQKPVHKVCVASAAPKEPSQLPVAV